MNGIFITFVHFSIEITVFACFFIKNVYFNISFLAVLDTANIFSKSAIC